MAGPGGGPPRRSHTKSRKGCETCKRRHIRCDENFPQCRNCTKHKIRCPYNDITMPDDRSTTPDKPDLMWNPEVEAALEKWRQTGVFPFPSLNIYPTPSPQVLTHEEMRLIYHVAAISHQLGAMDANGFTLWTRQIPTIIRIGASHRYVLHALLAFSAMHIAYLNECPLVGNMAYEHRGIALKGLQEAIGTFSRGTSDAILAASLVLSWQATDWRSWTQLMQGTSSVIEAMDAWKHESQFGDFIAESSTFPTAPPSPAPDHKPSQPSQEDLDVFQTTLQQLHKVESHLKQNGEGGDVRQFSQLVTFVKGARKVSHTLSVTEQFDRLQPLRRWLFWLPVLYLQQTRGSPNALVVIAHYYTVALVMERLFPEIGAAYFGSMTIGPVEQIARRLLSDKMMCGGGPIGADLQAALNLLEFPIDAVNEFRARMGWTQPPQPAPLVTRRAMSFPTFPRFGTPSFLVEDAVLVQTAATTPEYMPYPGTPAFSYSTEDLSVLPVTSGATTSCANNAATSPLQLASPFANPQYLSIPAQFGGYSPASSCFGDFGDASSIVYSDSEDFGNFDLGLSPTTPVLGDAQPLMGLSTKASPMARYLAFDDNNMPALSRSATSPFLAPEHLALLPIPESPIPAISFPATQTTGRSPYHHRYTSSTASAPAIFVHDREAVEQLLA